MPRIAGSSHSILRLETLHLLKFDSTTQIYSGACRPSFHSNPMMRAAWYTFPYFKRSTCPKSIFIIGRFGLIVHASPLIFTSCTSRRYLTHSQVFGSANADTGASTTTKTNRVASDFIQHSSSRCPQGEEEFPRNLLRTCSEPIRLSCQYLAYIRDNPEPDKKKSCPLFRKEIQAKN